MASEKGRPNIWYRKTDITSFIPPGRNVEASGDSELLKICVLIFKNLTCPQKFLATCLNFIFSNKNC